VPNVPANTRRIALVLGGGGLKGFAHLGVLRALEERGIKPVLYAGTSVGALLAAAYAGGMSIDEMTQRAHSLRRRDLFRLNHMRMLLERSRSSAIYQEDPLRELCRNCVPNVRFDELEMPVLVNTVDVERGTQVVWGLPGLRDVQVSDAVYASCALPGFFPPGQVDGRLCIDGGTIDNLPVAIAGHGVDAIIAVDVGSSDLTHNTDIGTQGFASIYMRAATLMMHALQQAPLDAWTGPPMLLVRPRIGHVGWFSFTHTADLIREGYRAATDALSQYDTFTSATGGIYPRRVVHLEVDQKRCNGCGICAALAPRTMATGADGKAYPVAEAVDWSPADGDFVRQCPTAAIHAKRVVPVLDTAAA
jgi:NTE family protein